jgi:hypothetical protein
LFVNFVLTPLLTDDHDRAGRMVGDLLAHRAEQQPGEAAAAARSDHDEIGAGGLVEERLRGGRLPSVGRTTTSRASARSAATSRRGWPARPASQP